MLKPSEAQLASASAEADALREAERDEAHLGHCYRYLEVRNEALEQVLEAVEHYLNSGQAPHEHSMLLKAVDTARSQAREPDAPDDGDFGL